MNVVQPGEPVPRKPSPESDLSCLDLSDSDSVVRPPGDCDSDDDCDSEGNLIPSSMNFNTVPTRAIVGVKSKGNLPFVSVIYQSSNSNP